MHPKFIWAFGLVRLPTPPAHWAVSVTALVTRFLVFGLSGRYALWRHHGCPTPRCCPLPTAHELLCPWDLWYWIKLFIQSHCACSVSWALSLGLNRPPHPFLTLISQPPFLLFAGIHSEHAWQHPVPVENTGGHIASWPGPLLLVSRRDWSCFLILPPYIHPFILLINTYGCYPSALWGTGVALAHLEVNVKHNLVLEETGATFNCMQLIKIFSNSQIFICSLSFTRLKLYRFYAAQANRKLQHIVLTVQDTNFFSF